MSYRVQIIDTKTGEVRWAHVEWDWFKPDGRDDLHWWTDGNFGCDCNRSLEFERAGGGCPDVDDDVDDVPCSAGGSNRFRVTHAELPDGSRVEIDGPTGEDAAPRGHST